MGGLPEGVRHPAAALLRTYVEEGIPSHMGPPWSPQALETAISKGPHTSACTPEMTSFIRGDMQQRIKYGFSILLLAADVVQVFGERLKMSRIAAVPQAHLRLRLILNLSAQPDSDTPSVNDTTDREVVPESLQFGRAFPRILQAVWEEDSDQVPVWVSKLDVTDAYHRGTVKPEQVGAFVYAIPSVPGEKGNIICIDLVLPMGWLETPKFFCAFSKMLTDMANTLVNTDLPVLSYGAISEIPETGLGPPAPLR